MVKRNACGCNGRVTNNKKIGKTDKLLGYKLGLATFTQAKIYLELGNFESDPRFPK